MGQFDNMARSVKEATDAEAWRHRQDEAALRAAEDQRFADDAALLDQEVMPVLKEAALAFDRAGVPCLLHRNWDERSRASNPSLLFRCKGERTSLSKTGGSYVPTGVVVTVTAAGRDLTVKTGRDRHERFGSTIHRGGS